MKMARQLHDLTIRQTNTAKSVPAYHLQ